MNQVPFLAGDLGTGHKTSSQVTKMLRQLILGRKELEPYDRCHCVCLAKLHRLICNMTNWFIHQVRAFDLASCQIFKSTFRGQNAKGSMRPDARHTIVLSICLNIFNSKVVSKNADITKKQHFCLSCPGNGKM